MCTGTEVGTSTLIVEGTHRVFRLLVMTHSDCTIVVFVGRWSLCRVVVISLRWTVDLPTVISTNRLPF